MLLTTTRVRVFFRIIGTFYTNLQYTQICTAESFCSPVNPSLPLLLFFPSKIFASPYSTKIERLNVF